MKKPIMNTVLCLLLSVSVMLPALPVQAAAMDEADTVVAETETTAPETDVITVTYAEAVAMTTKNLSSLLALEESMKPIKDQKEDLSYQLERMEEKFSKLPFKVPSSVYSPIKKAMTQLNRQINIIKLNQEMVKISTEMTLRNTLVNLANYEMDLALTTANVALNEENVRQVTLKHQYGTASDNDLRNAEQTLAQQQMNLETLTISLENERQTLSKLLQLPMTQRAAVTYERDLSEIPEDLTAYIKDKVKNEPTIKQKQINVDIKNSDVNDNEDKSKESSLQIEYDKAVREREDAKLSLEAAIRTNYNNLEQLFMREESLLLDLEKAQDNYRATQANFDAGKATQYHLDSVTLSILQSEMAIEKNRNSIWTLQFAFEHPFMLAN